MYEYLYGSDFGSGRMPITTIILVLLLIKLVLSCIPANIAQKKGYGFAGFYILGLLSFFIALIVSLCLYDRQQQLFEIKNAINSLATPASTADELEKYSKLLEQGAISQEEFDSVKKRIIGM